MWTAASPISQPPGSTALAPQAGVGLHGHMCRQFESACRVLQTVAAAVCAYLAAVEVSPQLRNFLLPHTSQAQLALPGVGGSPAAAL